MSRPGFLRTASDAVRTYVATWMLQMVLTVAPQTDWKVRLGAALSAWPEKEMVRMDREGVPRC